MKKLILLSFLMLSFSGISQEWNHKSRVRHFTAGAAIGGLGYEFGKAQEENRLLWTMGPATVVGILKEVVDVSKPDNHFNTSDILVTSMRADFSYLMSEFIGVPGYVMVGFGTVNLGISLQFQ